MENIQQANNMTYKGYYWKIMNKNILHNLEGSIKMEYLNKLKQNKRISFGISMD